MAGTATRPPCPCRPCPQAVGPETLPLEYGGTAAEVPVELAAQQLPAWRQQVLQQQGEPAAAAAAQRQQEAEEEAEALGRQLSTLRHSESTSDLPLAI